MNDYSNHRSLDLFAGTGWGVAHQALGAHEFGVEIMPEAVETRRANGMNTIYRDVWDVHRAESYSFDTLVASPPCQTFSMAGNGAGRKALDQVLSVVREGWSSIDELRDHALKMGDERIGLVLTPLHYAWAFHPEYIVLEQVPPVLPVWEAMAAQLREEGYSTWTGLLHFEQYGVPQTRTRAILIARRDGKVAKPPTPTHSRYYSRDPKKLDAGVKKWVSMAEALGWGMNERPYPTVASGTESGGGTDPAALGGSGARKMVHAERARGAWEPSGDVDNDAVDGKLRISATEAASLQSFPPFTAVSNYGSGGDPKARPERTSDQPAFTQTSKVYFIDGRQVEVDEVSAFQSYPPFVWCGGKTKQFLQIGNAVPPLGARAIIEEVWS